ncbi:hypothetical protein [Actinomadura mexicana]|uniref:Uncharacterized protein n=1 Tax=Actinomadura mexicana TaxID=134959 RepID=A0A238WZB8_9ACTN|nr:hypothetical protein [Actinomadura mexicana]SNR51792.1 hypothetical protein SAMN06265355_103487 [Actinomadura mexicana]
MTQPYRQAAHRPNVLLLLLGLLLIVIGAAAMLLGFLYGVQAVLGTGLGSDLGSADLSDAGGDLEPLVDGFTVVIVGCTVLTIGRYLWRGARRRGARDRIGRLLIILGYLVVCAALVIFTRFVLSALDAGDPGEGEKILFRGLIACAAVCVPGLLLALPGLRMAKERPLMEAEVEVNRPGPPPPPPPPPPRPYMR